MTVMARLGLILAATLALAACASLPPAPADPPSTPTAANVPRPCPPLTVMDDILRRQHSETPVWREIGGGHLMVLYLGPHGTWTMVAVAPSGRACIARAGGGGKLLRTGRDGGKAT